MRTSTHKFRFIDRQNVLRVDVYLKDLAYEEITKNADYDATKLLSELDAKHVSLSIKSFTGKILKVRLAKLMHYRWCCLLEVSTRQRYRLELPQLCPLSFFFILKLFPLSVGQLILSLQVISVDPLVSYWGQVFFPYLNL